MKIYSNKIAWEFMNSSTLKIDQKKQQNDLLLSMSQIPFCPKDSVEDRCHTVCLETFTQLAQLVEVRDKKIVAKQINLAKEVKTIPFSLLNNIKKDPELLKFVIKGIEEKGSSFGSEENLSQFKLILENDYKPVENIEDGWVVVTHNKNNPVNVITNNSNWHHYLTAIPSGLWSTTKFSCNAIKNGLIVGTFILSGVTALSSPNLPILNQLIKILITVLLKK